MSTLSSWIDPDEISELMPLLLPGNGEKEETHVAPSTEDSHAGIDDAGTPEDEKVPEPPAEAPAEAHPPVARDEVLEKAEPEEESDSAPPESTFNVSDAYDVSPFPEESAEAPDESSETVRQAAAVQAAVTLEQARNRANEGGLLRNTEEEEKVEAAPTPTPAAETEASAPQPKPIEDRTEPVSEAPEPMPMPMPMPIHPTRHRPGPFAIDWPGLPLRPRS